MSSPESPQSSRSSPTCSTCGKKFIRPEHLRRHIATSHTKDRKFPCEHCGKEFVRRDALQRHTLTHQQTVPSLIRRGGRACRSCSSAKARCSGDDPCLRCSQKSLSCFYPNRNNEPASLDASDSPRPVMESGFVDQQQNALVLQQPPQSISAQPMPVHFDPQSFDAGYWNASISSINWLPIDFPDYVDPSPTFDGSLDPFAWANAYGQPPDQVVGYENYNTQSSEAHQLTPQDPSPGSLVLGTSPSSSNKTRESQAGELYVDGEPARLPRVKRRRISTRHLAPVKDAITGQYSLAIGWNTSAAEDDDLPYINLDETTYQHFAQSVLYMSQTSESHIPQHSSHPGTPTSLFLESFHSDIPPKREMEYLLGLFAKNCLPLIPIVHPHALSQLSWQVTLAAAALGGHYIEAGAERFVLSAHELVRRILYLAAEDEQWLPSDSTARLQLKLLHCLGVIYSGDQRLQESGRQCLLSLASPDLMKVKPTTTTRNGSALDEEWSQFIQDETLSRTCHAIWLLDAQYAYQHHLPTLLTLGNNQRPLPCPPACWAAPTAQAWSQTGQSSHVQPTIASALQALYTDKSLPSATQICEFSRVLLIHGICHRTWSVAAYFSDPLSSYMPSATKSPSSSMSPTKIWLPANETFAKWRNSACDCLDVLHWAANATIGDNAGLEHPTIPHLHIARVILLAPCDSIVSLALHLVGEGQKHENEDAVNGHKALIRRWVTQDQYKARLAMIHAAVMFWHVRRFSANGWYEVDAVALSTLALWAFSAFSEGVKRSSRAASKSEAEGRSRAEDSGDRSESEEAVCDIILLDRPTDDELVQQFVRSGDNMKAQMNGVGDLYGPRAAEKVLVEGRKILKSLGAWGCRERWIRVLDRLVKISRARHVDKKNGPASEPHQVQG